MPSFPVGVSRISNTQIHKPRYLDCLARLPIACMPGCPVVVSLATKVWVPEPKYLDCLPTRNIMRARIAWIPTPEYLDPGTYIAQPG